MSLVVGAIVARNGGLDLAEAVGDLTAVLGAANVLVIDNASSDGSVNGLPVETRAWPENRGFAAGANLALDWARQRAAVGLLLLNQDARADAASLRAMIALLESDPNLGAVFAKVVKLDQPFVLDGLEGRRNYRHKLTTSLGEGRIDGGGAQAPRPIVHGHGAAMLLNAPAALTVGGFDERLFAYHEEVDLCWRLAKAHYGVMLEPRAVVRHRGPAANSDRAAAKAYLIGRNSLLAARKNGGRGAWLRVAGWALAAALLYYGPRALGGDAEAHALLAGWRDGLAGREPRAEYRRLL